MAFFGPAGNSESFFDRGYKHSTDVPKYVSEMGLNAFEYQCGRGVNIGLDKCRELKAEAEKYGIKMSLHSPYYISLSGEKEETRLNSLNYILQSAKAVDAMGGNRIVVHTGSCGKSTRREALERTKDTIIRALDMLKGEGLYHVHICPETMGKLNQLGDLLEVLEVCQLDESLIPCIDFGHLNARTLGGLKTASDFKAIFDTMEDKLGTDRMRNFHSHFSKIEYTAAGEKCHLTFADEVYGPQYYHMLDMAYKKGANPTVICESAGTQAEDAKTMCQYWNGLV